MGNSSSGYSVLWYSLPQACSRKSVLSVLPIAIDNASAGGRTRHGSSACFALTFSCPSKKEVRPVMASSAPGLLSRALYKLSTWSIPM